MMSSGLGGRGEVTGHGSKSLLNIIDGVRQQDGLLESEVQQGIQVVQRRGIAILKAHQPWHQQSKRDLSPLQALLNDPVLLRTIRQVLRH